MLVALGIPCAPEWGANEDDDNFESLYAMHFLTAVVSGVGCLLFFRLYSDAIKQARHGVPGNLRNTETRRWRRHWLSTLSTVES